MVVLLPYNLHAEKNEKFSLMMTKIISNSNFAKQCNYNKDKEVLVLKTRDNKEKKILCLWFFQNEKNQIVIDKADMDLKADTDYVLIGYGQNLSCPRLYYYIPSPKVKKIMNLKKMEKYLLSFPIYRNKF